jgi:hypothetical protein
MAMPLVTSWFVPVFSILWLHEADRARFHPHRLA